MTRTRTKPAPSPQPHALRDFDALTATAGVTVQLPDLPEGTPDPATLSEALSRALALAHDRWGLGLLHLRHEARFVRGDERDDVILLVDGRELTRLSQGAAAIAAAYAGLQALNGDGLSDWGVLEDGHRVSLKGGSGQLRVLIEDARDFETHWAPERNGMFSRTWRAGDTLAVEVHRPASPDTALADAAWDAITAIKDRPLQRELMERSNRLGMLGALLGARHEGAARNLERLPAAHFAVQSAVVRASGREARDFDGYKVMLREAAAQLNEAQGAATKQLAGVLSSGLR